MSNPFTSRTPQPMPQPPARKIQTPAGARLSAILEDSSNPPKPSSSHSSRKGFAGLTADPFKKHRPRSWMTTSIWHDPIAEEADGEKSPTNGGWRSPIDRFKDTKFVARRGGWKRFAIFATVIFLAIVALVVGLSIGLMKKDSSNNNNGMNGNGSGSGTPAGSPPPAASSGPFPIGAWNVETFLSTVATNCTSNSATWNCFPYQTHNQNPGNSAANFSWVISSTNTKSPSNSTLQIMSSNDIFGVTFDNTPLTLVNEGQAGEHYSFQLTQTKQVDPSSAIAPNGGTSTCFYNSTTLQGYLFTKMGKTFDGGSDSSSGGSGSSSLTPSSSSGSSSGVNPWPYAARVEQDAAAGANVPNCYATTNGVPGANITSLNAEADGEICSCLYANYVA